MTTILKKGDGAEVPFEKVASALASHEGLGNPLVLIGPNCAERSALLMAIRKRIESSEVGHKVLSTTMEEFRPRYIAAKQKRLLVGFRRKMKSADVLIVEAFESLARGCLIQEELVALMADYAEAGKQVIVTSEVPLLQIRGCSRTNIRIAELSGGAEVFFMG